MALPKVNPTQTAAWRKLSEHFNSMKSVKMTELFSEDPARADKFHINWNQFYVDYSKNIINKDTMDLLTSLAHECRLPEAIQKYFAGSAINETEKRAVLHTALRSNASVINLDGTDIVSDITAVKQKMQLFSGEIIAGVRKGFTGKPFTDVVNIGIGGSDLGPAMVLEALQFYQNHLKVHFVSNVDGDHVSETLKDLDPETTLFVVVSKTFTTQETLTNSETIRTWFLKSATEKDVRHHFVAVSSNVQKAADFGIDADNVFPMWDWVGGRFSLWSAVGLSICLGIGYDNFDKLLGGASEMDEHFETASFDKNIPVILALVSIWYNNFFNAESEAIIPYSQYLRKFAPYLQQGIMESNGKSVDRSGNAVDYQTGTIIWGEPGTNSQHAFFQLIHQGTKLIPTDFIGFSQSLYGDTNHHDKLMSNFFAQTEALMTGKSAERVTAEFHQSGIDAETANFLLPFKVFTGNKPTNTILINRLSPANLGALIAMYEHKIFVQGVIWNIYSYDQWGVELGKQLATSILDEIASEKISRHDSSTVRLLELYLKNRN
ncbi:MAG: glucose-6-phosphate isomerase [Flavobacterium sp.]|nr:glucose-6-phosphate isomerase [Flavobacterium sp.]